ncbi:FecR family protein [Parapedobacter deserti]|uniref:FecR family protein n=1 Tax=Parapedobacter deserti TaxID=1912957 RepID=A0ABV7JLY7_9SPHI
MDENDLAKLLDRYRRGQCTDAERLLIESLHLHAYTSEPVAEETATKKRVWKRLRKGLPPNGRKSSTPWLAAAASIILIAAIALLYRPVASDSAADQLTDIPAGGNKAILKLASGQTVHLDSSQHGVMVLSDRLLYTDSTFAGDFHNGHEAGESAYNEIITPRGGTYQVVLSDGTKVWLNADSKLIFPQRFARTMRQVTLVGEAYFEVTKSQHSPFVVKTAGQEIAVLGTSFNVAAYADERLEQTTLVEGEIMVSTAQRARQLVPGDQAIVNAGEISVDKVDTSPFIAWKSGFIAFNEETLEHIMRDISRWYDVDIHFEGVDKQLRFGGTVSRYANVSEVLRRLELTGQIHFKIEERGIVIKP